ncbi:TPA: type 2 lantipeptide synthetase LanM, partial [Streptococcus suis]|nr:type 2 lantipeptide synthetase LanM [Streptococcus suis]
SNVLDMTYYVGKLGILSTLVRISQITKQEIPQKILNSKVTLIKQALQNTPADFLTGFSSSILACDDDEYSEEFLRAMIKRFEELKQDDSNNNYIYWGKEESNNVS